MKYIVLTYETDDFLHLKDLSLKSTEILDQTNMKIFSVNHHYMHRGMSELDVRGWDVMSWFNKSGKYCYQAIVEIKKIHNLLNSEFFEGKNTVVNDVKKYLREKNLNILLK